MFESPLYMWETTCTNLFWKSLHFLLEVNEKTKNELIYWKKSLIIWVIERLTECCHILNNLLSISVDLQFEVPELNLCVILVIKVSWEKYNSLQLNNNQQKSQVLICISQQPEASALQWSLKSKWKWQLANSLLVKKTITTCCSVTSSHRGNPQLKESGCSWSRYGKRLSGALLFILQRSSTASPVFSVPALWHDSYHSLCPESSLELTQ